ncbi:UbiA family prenyltransferase [Rhabdobacter roseus]|uniref:4-hydroxybenzoate polyprenyltransferase n=1 Tax=Rhabdobacter roseus TaxID=1655419 RepID=A0A840TL72_9BACT|nr:UbiA family prenyltransferase [Rhabdobacter roseus]MBB5282312.1 4-hydroxybenzoate polyprenyltransferase [Rhabdobacter roseus]
MSRSAHLSNEFSRIEENQAPFLKRLYIYQKERFPLLGHGLLVLAFSFSAVSYSRICRGVEGFIDGTTFAVGAITTVSLFLLVRIADEFKDAADDARFRPELPVPRGLVSFRELGTLAVGAVVLQVALNALFFPKMLVLYLVVVTYLGLMTKEFFVAAWLKKHQFWYVTSHMFIIPLVDVYASGLDWYLEGAAAPVGLLFFFGVSYLNGIVLEIGRKIRAPEQEAEGVLTYTAMLGGRRAVVLWLGVLLLTLVMSILASYFAGYGKTGFVVLGVLFSLCSWPAVLFLQQRSPKRARLIEAASALWTIAMYLTLGGGPMLTKLLFD